MSPRRAIKIGCILVPGDRLTSGAVPTLTVSENVNQPVLARVSRAWALAEAALLHNASVLADRFDVRPRDPTRLLGALSGGNQQKALLAKWFQTEPRLILLDEPTQGVDVGARAQVFDAIAEAARSGAAVLCASSDYEQLTAICDRVLVFNRGAARTCWSATRSIKSRSRRPVTAPVIQLETALKKMTARGAAKQRGRRAEWFERFALVLVWALTIALFGFLRPDSFLTWSNFATILGSQSVIVVMRSVSSFR